MIKKIAIISTLVSTLLYGESDIPNQTGFFVGLDISHMSTETRYNKSGSGITTANYSSTGTLTPLSLKLGYQYYFTRIYARVNTSSSYDDNAKQRYKIDSQVYELDVDYLPVFYRSDDKFWTIKGVFGVGLGANKSALTYYDARLDSIGTNLEAILNKETQWNMQYGLQAGVQVELDFGLSAELGYRYRSGLMTEFSDTDGANEATFKLLSDEVYLGLNYLF